MHATVRNCLGLAIITVPVITSGALLEAQEPLSVQDFYGLSHNDRCEVFYQALRDRARKLHNVRVVYTSRSGNAKWEDGVVWETLDFTTRDETELLQIGPSHRLVFRTFPEINGERLFEATTHWNATSSVARSLVQHRQYKDLHARIGPKQDRVARYISYAHWLAEFVHEDIAPHIACFLAINENRNREAADYLLQFEEPAGVPAHIVARLEVTGKGMGKGYHEVFRAWSDPHRGYLITKAERLHQQTVGDRHDTYLRIEFLVRETRQVDGVWMPWHALVTSQATKAEPTKVGVCEINVESIELGHLTNADLEVVFPPDTRVNDMFRRVTYVAGDEDHAVPYSYGPAPAERSPSARTWLLWSNACALLLVVLSTTAYWYCQRRVCRRANPQGDPQ